MIPGPPCSAAGCTCTHTSPCDRGWLWEEGPPQPRREAVPEAERTKGGPVLRAAADGSTERPPRVRRCPVCAEALPPAPLPNKRYGKPKPEGRYESPPSWHDRDRD